MKIRPQQMEAMAAYSRRQFENQMIRQVREEFPEETREADDEDVRAFVREQIDKAASYGITTKEDVEVYIDRAAFYGDAWDTSLDWAHEILSRPDVDGADKIQEIRRYEAVELGEE